MTYTYNQNTGRLMKTTVNSVTIMKQCNSLIVTHNLFFREVANVTQQQRRRSHSLRFLVKKSDAGDVT